MTTFKWQLYMYQSHGFFIGLSLDFLCVGWPVILPVMEYAGSCPVGLSKPSHEFRLKYLSKPYIISKQTTTCINCAK